jgi:hypothetical protein
MRKRFAIPLWLVGVLLVLVAVRIALPFVVRDQLNTRMAQMGEYSGEVERVRLALWRGAYVLYDLDIQKVSGDVPVPFFHAPRTHISLSWRHLFRGRVVGEVAFHAPELNFVDGGNADDSQAGLGVDWREQLAGIMPFQLNQVDVHDGTIHFRNFNSNPPIDATVEQVQARIENLGNVVNEREDDRDASLEADGLLLGQAPLEVRAALDPVGRTDDFALEVRITELQLVELNDIAREYAYIDFESGHGEFVLELQARDGALDGYAKPLFHDMQIFSWQSDVREGDKNPLQLAWEATVEVVTSVFQNQPEQQFATRVPIQGSIDDRELGVLPAIGGILRNAFIEAYRADFEGLGPRPDVD